MLRAKNLKVALAAILGVVGLMGGTAHAQIDLIPRGADPSADHMVPYFAAEPLATSTHILVSATSSGFNVSADLSAGLEVRRYYLRVDLLEGGGHTGSNSTLRNARTDDDDNPVPIGIRFSEAVVNGASVPQLFNVNALQTPAATLLEVPGQYREALIYTIDVTPGATAVAIPRNAGRLAWVLPNDAYEVRLSSGTSEETFYLRMSLWNGRGDAQRADFDNLGSQAPIWAGANSVLETKRTLTTEVQDPRVITATVTSNFRKFREENSNPSGPTGRTTADYGRLATARVTFQSAVGTREILHHDDGNQVTLPDVLQTVNVGVRGDAGTSSYNFGDFYLDPAGAGCSVREMGRLLPMGMTGTATATSTDSLSSGLSSAVVAAQLQPVPAMTRLPWFLGERALSAGDAERAQFVFCANVLENTPGRALDEFPLRISPVTYTMTLGTTLVSGASGMHGAEATGGQIRTDGTRVRISYLTPTRDFPGGREGMYNQRLVIANHGTSMVAYTLGDFAPEPGKVVNALPAASGELMPSSSVVIPVSNLIELTGEGPNRTAAVLTLIGAPGDISVATTQVTLPEGQTDTVRHHPLTER